MSAYDLTVQTASSNYNTVLSLKTTIASFATRDSVSLVVISILLFLKMAMAAALSLLMRFFLGIVNICNKQKTCKYKLRYRKDLTVLFVDQTGSNKWGLDLTAKFFISGIQSNM